MKSLSLSLLFILTFTAFTFAAPTLDKDLNDPSFAEAQSTLQTRELVRTLHLNEMDYIQIKKLSHAKFQEIENVLRLNEAKSPEATAAIAKIDEDFKIAVSKLLTADQKETWASLNEAKK